MNTSPTNRFGRRGGRGIRPWLLIPKVIAVAIYVGTLTAACAIWLAGDFNSLDKSDPQRMWMINLMRLLFVYVAVPALLLAIALGVALLMQMPRVLIRLRWLQVKLVLLAVLVPAAHLFISSRLKLLRDALDAGHANDAAARQFGIGLIATLIGTILVVILGRLKPRLGQNWARSYSASPSTIEIARDDS